ncbi:MAG: hypothetical protein AABY16_01365 [Nanoarchaeota archaeon]
MRNKARLGLAGIILAGLLSGCGSKEKTTPEPSVRYDKFFMCNEWRDKNFDGQISYPEEYLNINGIFRGNESLAFIFMGSEDRNLRGELEYKTIGHTYRLDKTFVPGDSNVQAFTLKNMAFLSPGGYVARFYDRNNEFVESRSFQVDEFLDIYACRKIEPDSEIVERADVLNIDDSIEVHIDLSRKKEGELKVLIYGPSSEEILQFDDRIKALHQHSFTITLSDPMKKSGTHFLIGSIDNEIITSKSFEIRIPRMPSIVR